MTGVQTCALPICDLLVEIMGSNIEQEVMDETGTDDFKESDL